MDSDPRNTPTFRTRLRLFLINTLYIAAAVLLAALIQAFVIRPFIVSGNSMVPNIHDKEYLLVDEITYRTREPERGEVVVFRAPPEPGKYYIKRIIGLPGETVRIADGTVTIINDEHPEGLVLSEPYIRYNQTDEVMTVTVPEGTYFVMGDNRTGSYDSRGWGPLDEDEIRGRALLRLLPLTRIDYLPAIATYE